MLDEGVRLAFEHLGFDFRTIAYVEWEGYAASQLVSLMEAQCMDPAPIWCGDLGRFDCAPFRGVVDCIVAGFPCQPHSVAGERRGLEDERWIWPEIARTVRDLRPRFVVLENVAGLITSGGLASCLGDLARLGFDAEWCLLSASDVGAAQERERLFVFAWLADAGCESIDVQQRAQRAPEYSRSRDGVAVADAGCGDSRRDESQPVSGCGGSTDAADCLAHVADAGGARSQGDQLCAACDADRDGPAASGSVTELCGVFAPGPLDARWREIIERFPFLAPATDAGVRGVADGLAVVLHESRTHQLRAIGNGVVPLCAAAAVVLLARRAGIFEVGH